MVHVSSPGIWMGCVAHGQFLSPRPRGSQLLGKKSDSPETTLHENRTLLSTSQFPPISAQIPIM